MLSDQPLPEASGDEPPSAPFAHHFNRPLHLSVIDPYAGRPGAPALRASKHDQVHGVLTEILAMVAGSVEEKCANQLLAQLFTSAGHQQIQCPVTVRSRERQDRGGKPVRYWELLLERPTAWPLTVALEVERDHRSGFFQVCQVRRLNLDGQLLGARALVELKVPRPETASYIRQAHAADSAWLHGLPLTRPALSDELRQWRDLLDFRQRLLERDKVSFKAEIQTIRQHRVALRLTCAATGVEEELLRRQQELILNLPDDEAPEGRRSFVGRADGIRCDEGVLRLDLELDQRSRQTWDHHSYEPGDVGELVNDLSGDLAAMRVQREALDCFANGLGANPRLHEFLFDATRAHHPEESQIRGCALALPDRLRRLNPNQELATRIGVAGGDLTLIMGPPGTGKTTVIAAICSELARRGQRVLLASQNHLAVDNAMERLQDLPGIRPLRWCNERNQDRVLRNLIEPEVVSWYLKIHAKRLSQPADAAVAPVVERFRSAALTLSDSARDRLTPTYLDLANVVGSTCHGCTDLPETWTFDVVIIDEVSKATPPELLPALLRAKRAILVGDHRQLPPTWRNDDRSWRSTIDAGDLGMDARTQFADFKHLVEDSFFRRLWHQIGSSGRVMLDIQYRAHPGISKVYAPFYSGGISDGVTADQRQHGMDIRLPWAGQTISPRQPVVWLDTSRCGEELQRGAGKDNPGEAQAIITTITAIAASLARRPDKELPTIGVIAMYKAQMALLDRLLKEAKRKDRCVGRLSIQVSTVDQFQGRECDIMLVSMVRSAVSEKSAFIKDYRRVNVAFSRARTLLVIAGNRPCYADTAVTIEPWPEEPGADPEPLKVYQDILAHIDDRGVILEVPRAHHR